MNGKGSVYALVSIVLWSAFAVLTTYAVPLSPLLVTGIISFVSGGFNMTYFRVTEKCGYASQFRLTATIYAIGALGTLVNEYAFTQAIMIGPAGEANVINYLWPMLIVLFAPIFLHDRLHGRHYVGLTMAVAGFLVLTLVFKGTQLSLDIGAGHIWALVAAVSWGLYSVLAKKFAVPDHGVGATRLVFGLLLIVLSLASEDFIPWSLANALSVLALCVFSVFAYLYWNKAFRVGDSASIGVLSYLTPLLSTFWLVIFGATPFTWSLAFASILVVSGAVVSNYPAVRDVIFKGRKNDV